MGEKSVKRQKKIRTMNRKQFEIRQILIQLYKLSKYATKRQRFSEWIKMRLTYVVYKKLTLNIKTKKDYKQSNRERQININQKKAGSMLIKRKLESL